MVAENIAQQVLITRDFAAPRELVFRAWADVEQMQRWHAPTGCDIRFLRFDFREGGGFHSCITVPGGHECWCLGEYLEISPPERIEFTMAVVDEDGQLMEPVDMGMDPEWPRKTVVAVSFEEVPGGTRSTLHQTVSEALAKRTGAHPSWINMLDRLAGELAASGDS